MKWVNDTQERLLMLQAVLPLCPNKPSVFIKFGPACPRAYSGPHASGSKLLLLRSHKSQVYITFGGKDILLHLTGTIMLFSKPSKGLCESQKRGIMINQFE